MLGIMREAHQPRGEMIEWIRITPGVRWEIRNPDEEWLSYLIVEA